MRSSFAERNIPTEAHRQRVLMALRAMSLSARCVLARTVDMFLFPTQSYAVIFVRANKKYPSNSCTQLFFVPMQEANEQLDTHHQGNAESWFCFKVGIARGVLWAARTLMLPDMQTISQPISQLTRCPNKQVVGNKELPQLPQTVKSKASTSDLHLTQCLVTLKV